MSSEHKAAIVTLVPSGDNVDTCELDAVQIFCVHSVKRIRSEATEYVQLGYSLGDLADPRSRPLLIGSMRVCARGQFPQWQLITTTHIAGRHDSPGPQLANYLERAIWEDRVWRIVEEDFFQMVHQLALTKHGEKTRAET